MRRPGAPVAGLAGDVDEFGRAAGEGHWVVVCLGRIATAMR